MRLQTRDLLLQLEDLLVLLVLLKEAISQTFLDRKSEMAHLLDHPLHLGEHFGPKDCGIPNTGVDCQVNLIWCIMLLQDMMGEKTKVH